MWPISKQHHAPESAGNDLVGYLTRQVEANALWTQLLVAEGLGCFSFHPRDPISWWLMDICHGVAFAGSVCPPKVSICQDLTLSARYGIQPGLRSRTAEIYPTKIVDIRLNYQPLNQTLEGTIGEHLISIKQTFAVRGDQKELRGGRNRLCDGNPIDKSLQSTLESILGGFELEEQLRFADNESSVSQGPPSKNPEADILLAAFEMYSLDLNNDRCAKIVDWLESRMTPILKVDTVAEALEMVKRVAGKYERPSALENPYALQTPPVASPQVHTQTPSRREGRLASEIVEQMWKARGSRGQFKDLRDLWIFVQPAVSLKVKGPIWVACFEELYRPFNGVSMYKVLAARQGRSRPDRP